MPPASDSSAPDDSAGKPSESSPTGKRHRFRQEAADDTGKNQWFRLFLAAASLGVTVLVLGVVLWSFFGPSAKKPLLLVLTVADYESRLIPPIAFAEQDTASLIDSEYVTTTAAGLPEGSAKLHTKRDLERFFDDILPAIQNDTLIIYITAHGVSDPLNGYVLHSDFSLDQPGTGHSIRYVLRRTAAAPAKNKLLILNTTHIESSAELGMLSNDFAYHLKREFASLKAEFQQPDGQNFWVLCSADDAQLAWSSYESQLSAFGASVAYCLHGGPDADRSGLDGSGDDMLSAGELAAYVERNVSNWTPRYRARLQRPFHLHIGGDFPLTPVDDGVLSQEWIANRVALRDVGQFETQEKEEATGDGKEEAAPEGKETESAPADDKEKSAGDDKAKEQDGKSAEAGDGGKKEKGADGKPDAGGGGSAKPVLTTEAVLEKTTRFWKERNRLASRPTVIRRPRHWSLLQQELIRAEKMLLAGKVDDANRLLDSSLPRLVQVLDTPAATLPVPPWSLAKFDPENKNDPLAAEAELIEKVLAEPTSANLEKLQPVQLVEAAYLRLFAGRLRDGEAWRFPQAVRDAVETRTLAEKSALFSSPVLLPFVKSRIEQGDRQRRLAETALLLGRVSEALDGLARARRLYGTAMSRTRDVARQLAIVERTILDAWSIVRWLEHVPYDWNARTDTAEQLNQFFVSLREFRDKPNRVLLQRLVGLSIDLRQRAREFASTSWQRVKVAQTLAALEIPFLEADMRRDLIGALLQAHDGDLFRRVDSSTATDDRMTFVDGFPFLKFVPVISNNASIVTQFAGPETNARQENREQVRKMRAQIGQQAKSLLRALRTKSAAIPPGGDVWPQHVIHLAQSPLQTSRGLLLQSDDPVSRTLDNRAAAEVLKWNVERLHADRASLPAEFSTTIPELLAGVIRQTDASFTGDYGLRPGFELQIPEIAKLLINGSLEIPFILRAERSVGEQDTTFLSIDLGAARDAWSVILVPEQDAVTTPQGNLTTVSRTPVVGRSPDRHTARHPSGRPSVGQVGGAGDPPTTGATDTSVSGGWLEIPLSGLRSGQPRAFRIRMSPRSADAGKAPMILMTRVVKPSGEADWLPLPIRFAVPVIKPAEILVSWKQASEKNGTADLYPNETMPIQIAIRKNVAAALNLRVEFDGGGPSPGSIPFIAPEKTTGVIPVPPQKGFELPLRRSGFVVRLFAGKELLDHRSVDVAVLDPSRYVRASVEYDPETRVVRARIHRVGFSDAQQPTSFQLELTGIEIEKGSLVAELPPDRDDVVLDAVVPPQYDDDLMEAIVSVSGVPRVFHFKVGSLQAAGIRTEKFDLSIISPQSRTAYAANGSEADSLAVQVRADGPREARLHVGIDRNNNGLLDLEERERQPGNMFWSAKSVEVSLAAAVEPPGFVIGSRVSDVKLSIDSTGLKGRQTILVELQGVNHRLTEAVGVYRLANAPAITIDSPKELAQHPVGKPIPLIVRSLSPDFGAVDRVEFAVDKNGNGAWDDDEVLAPIGTTPEEPIRFVDGSTVQANITSTGLTPPETLLIKTPDSKTSELKREGGIDQPQTVVLMARAVTSVVDPKSKTGKAEVLSPIARRTIVLTPPLPETIPPGTVIGTVVDFNGTPQAGVAVYVDGVEFVSTKPDGTFKLPGVPPGEQTVIANAKKRAGQQKVEVKSAEISKTEIIIQLK